MALFRSRSVQWCRTCLWLLTISLTYAQFDYNLDYNAISAPHLDLSSLGRIAFTGDFDALSTYDYQESVITTLGSNGTSQSLRAQLPDGTFMIVASADASIEKMCLFSMGDEPAGVIVAGNFTSLGGVDAQSIALFNYTLTGGYVTPLPGISGQVRALSCDANTSTIYVAGSFEAGNSTNIITWVASSGWTYLPFAGFNGPVNTIELGPTGNILFGGNFSAIGDSDPTPDSRVNSLFEFDPNNTVVDNSLKTPLIEAGLELNLRATINQILKVGNSVYVAGNFNCSRYHNIFVLADGKTNSLPGGGLNGQVSTLYFLEERNMLFVGGNFTDTSKPSNPGLKSVAAYSTADNQWHALGGGVLGTVQSLDTLSLNITPNKPETILMVSGDFAGLSAFGDNPRVPVKSLGAWVPSKNNWLSNLDVLNQPDYEGELSTSVEIPGSTRLFAGTLSSWILSATGVIEFNFNSGQTSLGSLGLKMQQDGISNGGVSAGLFYTDEGLNVTIVGGSFDAEGTNSTWIHNVAFINGSNEDHVSGMPGFSANAQIFCLEVFNRTLFAGGSFTQDVHGQGVNGLVLFDIARNSYTDLQPPPLGGSDVAVNVISTRPGTGEIYVGGTFDTAGDSDCPAVCIYDTSSSAWKRVGSKKIGGSVSFMTWTSPDTLVVGGEILIEGSTLSLATYYAPAGQWTPFNEIHPLTGSVTAMSPTSAGGGSYSGSSWSSDSTGFWVAGTTRKDAAFLQKWNGTAWHSVSRDTFGPDSKILGLQLFLLSKPGVPNEFLPANEILLVIGNIKLPDIGSVSAAFFNGTSFTPYIFTKTAAGDSGTLSSIFSQNTASYARSSSQYGKVVGIAVGVLVVLISIIAIGEVENIWHQQRGKSGHVKPSPFSSILGRGDANGDYEMKGLFLKSPRYAPVQESEPSPGCPTET